MNRETLRSRFRSECPEITDRVVSDTILNGWMLDGDKDICQITKCIRSNTPETFDAVEDTQYYDLTSNITKFQEIDEYPGGGVWFDNKPLKKATESEMNYILTNWKDDPTSSTPQRYFRRNQYLWFDVPPDSTDEIAISTIYVSDDFDNDSKTPFNQLSYLEPYHPGVLKYAQWKAKQKVGKDNEAKKAEMEYYTFVKRMKKNIDGSMNDKAHIIVRSNYNGSNGKY